MMADIYPSGSEGESFSETVSPSVDLSIKEYYFVGEGDSYDKHFFVIDVMAGPVAYTVDRSYVDFVEFDRRIKKSFPDSAVPSLPLDATYRLQQLIVREASILLDKKKPGTPSSSPSRKSFVSVNDSSTLPSDMRKSTAKNIFKIPVTATEVMKQYESSLTLYLSDISCHHELLTSDILHTFLDEEVVSLFNESIPPTLTVFDLLLINSPVQKCIVHRIEEHYFQLPADSLLVWKFFTAQYDIGFSVESESGSRLPFSRYNAHEKPICGAIESKVPTAVKLVWNNTYAKLYAKNLTWAVRVVSRDQFQEAKREAVECYREKKRFEHQRNMFRLSSFRQATMTSRIMHGDITEQLYEEDYEMTLKLNETRLRSLQVSNDVLLKDLEKAEIRLNEVESRTKDYKGSRTARVSETMHEELEELRTENSDLHAALSEAQDDLQQKDLQIEELDKNCKITTQRFATIQNEIIELSGHLDDQLDRLRDEFVLSTEAYESHQAALNKALLADANGEGGAENIVNHTREWAYSVLEDVNQRNESRYQILLQLNGLSEHLHGLSEY